MQYITQNIDGISEKTSDKAEYIFIKKCLFT